MDTYNNCRRKLINFLIDLQINNKYVKVKNSEYTMFLLCNLKAIRACMLINI